MTKCFYHYMLNRQLFNNEYNECDVHSLSCNNGLPDKVGKEDFTDSETISSETHDEWTTVRPSKRKFNKVSSEKFSETLPNKRKWVKWETNREVSKEVSKEVWVRVYETWEDYQNTLKGIDLGQHGTGNFGNRNCDWVYKIFEGKQELENVVCVTKEFLIVTNNGKSFRDSLKINPNKFTLVVLLFDLEIRTLRDLEQKHIRLLFRMKQKACEVIKDYLGSYFLDDSKLRFEFHYTPSTYQLHLNVKFNRRLETEENRIQRVYLFDTVIKNLELDSEFYKKPMVIHVKDELEWKTNLSKWSRTNLEMLERTRYNFETLEFWKFFEHMECYKKYA